MSRKTKPNGFVEGVDSKTKLVWMRLGVYRIIPTTRYGEAAGEHYRR